MQIWVAQLYAVVSFFILSCFFINTTLYADGYLVGSISVNELVSTQISMRKLLARGVSRQAVRAAMGTDKHKHKRKQVAPHRQLRINYKENRVHFSLSHLHLRVGETLTVQTHDYSTGEVEVYVRDDGTAVWQEDTHSLQAKKHGKTEVIFIVAKNLHILPLTVVAAEVEEEAVVEHVAQAAQDEITEPADVTAHFAPEGVNFPSADSSFQQRNGVFLRREQQPTYGRIEIQIVDERSVGDFLYPVEGLKVQMLGTNLRLQTDVQGVVKITGVPRAGRFMLKFSDPLGRYLAGMQEVLLTEGVRRYRLTALRGVVADSMGTISRKAQHADLASMCGEIERGEYRLEVDVVAAGVYYFNELGLLDPSRNDTSANGRFCLFNVESGPMTLFVKDPQNRQLGIFTVGLVAGYHTEETFSLPMRDAPFRTWLSALGVSKSERQLVDFAQARLLGVDNYLAQHDEGMLATSVSPAFHRQRSHLLVQDAEFEPTLHQIDVQGEHVLSLLPRGTIESVALHAGEVYDHALGSVYIEYGKSDAQGDEVVFRLLDARGREIQPVWSEQEDADAFAVFLNLDYGVYQAVVENTQGHWLAVQSLMVYSETVSHLRTGATISYHPTD